MNLRHLQAFAAVAAAGSVTQAAEHLFRVASAVTRALAELEDSLGVRLFERKARGMMLTVYGNAVLIRAQRVSLELAAACNDLPVGAGGRRMLDARTLQAAVFSARRLALFAGLAEHHHMPTVAQRFGVTQPALSALVRDLESRTGCALFSRSAQGIQPTRAGALLAFRFRRALAELRAVNSDLAAIRGVVQGSVVVGALPLSRTRVLPLAIATLLHKHPQVHVSTVESPYEALAAALRSGDVDFIIGALRPAEQVRDLVQEPLFEDSIALVARAGHPLARRRRITFADLHRARWVLSRRGAPARDLFERSFEHRGQIAPEPAVETGDLALLRGLLQDTDMLTAISAHQLHYEIEAGTLVVLSFALEATQRTIGIAQREGVLASPCTSALLNEIRAGVAAL
ncbi:LysR substrate-binding domain-containing protein [Variovorax dokdonensis]|uniref:LysR substrate-binding domain-containing protein n=1 Tax=Variovorax dokdonensis TaxID=344883 RepID=A0ABT7N929_9BURK|nr:LysR substrate-binding domain-containing protein [Variovorax dokdonensis]MDM0044443.1 LysR substrate-binding domain-containing protein [Variovorax dokdonensis]